MSDTVTATVTHFGTLVRVICYSLNDDGKRIAYVQYPDKTEAWVLYSELVIVKG